MCISLHTLLTLILLNMSPQIPQWMLLKLPVMQPWTLSPHYAASHPIVRLLWWFLHLFLSLSLWSDVLMPPSEKLQWHFFFFFKFYALSLPHLATKYWQSSQDSHKSNLYFSLLKTKQTICTFLLIHDHIHKAVQFCGHNSFLYNSNKWGYSRCVYLLVSTLVCKYFLYAESEGSSWDVPVIWVDTGVGGNGSRMYILVFVLTLKCMIAALPIIFNMIATWNCKTYTFIMKLQINYGFLRQ